MNFNFKTHTLPKYVYSRLTLPIKKRSNMSICPDGSTQYNTTPKYEEIEALLISVDAVYTNEMGPSVN